MSGEIKSSLGSVKFNRHQPQKVLTVEDSTDEDFNDQKQIDQKELLEAQLERLKHLESVKAEARQLKKQAPPEAKNRLDILLGIARSARDVEIDGITFSIRSLKAKEIQEITEKLLELGSTSETIARLEMRKHLVARSLYAIDSQDIDLVIGSKSIEDRLNFVDELDESLVQHLSNIYGEMKADNDRRFSDLGKTQEEVQDNIKKS